MHRHSIIVTLFFVSGACSLIYQVIWSRMMSLVFGRGVLSVGIVLAAFMAGLALGSYLLGKFSDKSRNPLRLYAIYEIGIGVTALASSSLLMQGTPFLLWIHTTFDASPITASIFRFLIAFLILIAPTFLMGATLPILSRALIRRVQKVGRDLGKLYAINTLGAVAGAIAAGFLFIRLFGVQGTIYLAVAGNIGVGLLAFIVSKHYSLEEKEIVESEPELPTVEDNAIILPSRSVAILLLCVFAFSGFASFAYEIFWTRSLVFILGNTTYAFTLMLTAFLTGITLGSYFIPIVVARIKNRLRLFAAIEILIGLLSASSLPVLFYIVESDTIQSFVLDLSNDIGLMVLSQSIIALSVMLLSAILIGSTLPLMGQIFVRDLRFTGTTVGKVYAVNTLGNVVGALLPGLLIIPLVGIQKGILLISALNICLGFIVLVADLKKTAALSILPIGIFLILIIVIVKIPSTFQFPTDSQTSNDAVLFYEEGAMVTTKVWIDSTFGNKHISIDGINIGGTESADYKQQILAHLPKLLLKSYNSELSIGLGSGILIGESAQHSKLKQILCVEIAPSVVRGAEFFSEENHNILDDSRTKIVIDDINHFLQTSSKKFDIISADGKTAEKYSSNTFMYSREYYELLRQRLSSKGLVIQWVPTALPSSQYKLVLRTFLNSFPHVSLWHFPPVGRLILPNTFLIGSNVRIDIDPDGINQAIASDPAAFDGISKYGLKSAEEVLSHFIASEETLRSTVSPGPINSFDFPFYEFYSPTDYALPWPKRALENIRLLMSLRGPDFWEIVLDKSDGPMRERLLQTFNAEGVFLKGYEAQLQELPYTTVVKLLDQAVNIAPWSDVLTRQSIAYYMDQFKTSWQRLDYDRTLDLGRRATQKYPLNAEAHEYYGIALMQTNQLESAAFEFQSALSLDPGLIYSRRSLGLIYAAKGNIVKATELWKEILANNSNDIMTLVFIGTQIAQHGSVPEGKKYLQRAYELSPENPAVINGYAHVLYLAGDFLKARDIVKAGERYYEVNPSFQAIRDKILGNDN